MGTHAETHKATIDLLSHNNGSMLNTRNTCFMHPRRVQANETGVTGNKLHMRISQNGEKNTSKKCTISHTARRNARVIHSSSDA